MRKWIIGILVVLVAAGSIFWTTADKDIRRLILNMPTDKDVLFWSIPQRDAAFRVMDRAPLVVKSRIISTGNNVYPLPKGAPLDVGIDVDAYMKDQRTAGLVIIQDGKIRLEKYGLDFSGDGRWTSFSVANHSPRHWSVRQSKMAISRASTIRCLTTFPTSKCRSMMMSR